MPVDANGNEIPEVDSNVVEGEQGTDAQVEDTAPQTFTAEQVNEIVSQRVNEVRDQSSQELNSRIAQLEATLNGYRQSVENSQRQSSPYAGIEDDPEPPGLTQNEQIIWHASKPQRLAFKKQIAELTGTVQQLVKPLQADGVATQFFSEVSQRYGGKAIPEPVKQKTLALYRENLRNPQFAHAKQEDLLGACYQRALAIQQEETMFGVAKPGVTTNGKPAPRIGTPPSAAGDLGSSSRAPGVGRIGASKKETTWQEDMEFLINNNKFPEDLI